MKTFQFMLVFMILTRAGPAGAGEPSRQAVLTLLQGYEWRLDHPAFEALGPEVDKALLSIARDDSVPKLIGARAAAALSMYPTDDVWAFYLARLHKSSDPVQQRRTVDALCHAFAISRASDLVAALAPVLTGTDIQLRIRAARCLQSLPGELAAGSLEDYRLGITDSWELRAAGFEVQNL
jgi:hypothetical protein